MWMTVVVTVVDGGAALPRLLDALDAQRGAPALDVVVPLDDSIAQLREVAAGHRARILELGPLGTAAPPCSHASQHELFDRRRAAGLAAATGEVIAMIEDRVVPRPDWAAAHASLHGRLPHAVIGGAVVHGGKGALSRAVFLSDYGRYEPPFTDGLRDYVTDVNLSYKRRALDSTRELWRERYHETTVHWALSRAGETLWLSAEPVVEQYRQVRLAPLLAERFAWGRLFAATRARESAVPARLLRAALTPVLPLVLAARLARLELAHRGAAGLPAMLAAALPPLAAWAMGEAAGELTGRP